MVIKNVHLSLYAVASMTKRYMLKHFMSVKSALPLIAHLSV